MCSFQSLRIGCTGRWAFLFEEMKTVEKRYYLTKIILLQRHFPTSDDLSGAQAQYVKVPLADSTLYKLDGLGNSLPEETLLLMADIFPTGKRFEFESSRSVYSSLEKEFFAYLCSFSFSHLNRSSGYFVAQNAWLMLNEEERKDATCVGESC